MENLVNEHGKIIYDNIIARYPWIVAENQKCILSPDSDGLLCGLLMSAMFNWKIVGFYDGKVMALKQKENTKDCIFLDMEIFRDYVKSLGQHMLLWDNKNIPPNWNNFCNCISPNNIRKYDGKNNFRGKYPLGTIHVLLGIVGCYKKIEISKDAICPLLYVDGTFKNLFNYPENCLNWLDFLCAEDKDSPLKTVFFNDHYTMASLMQALNDFFKKLKEIGKGKRGADKIIISDKNGEPKNLKQIGNSFAIVDTQKNTAINFLLLLSSLTGWKLDEKQWTFENLSVYKFTKGSIKPNGRNFKELISKNPLSWAMTSSLAIEYTLEEPDRLMDASNQLNACF
jgi:hypothetical protein